MIRTGAGALCVWQGTIPNRHHPDFMKVMVLETLFVVILAAG